MKNKYYAKILAKDEIGLQYISACCEDAKIVVDNIKYLKKNKIFLLHMTRLDNEKNKMREINSICKFEFIDNVKSINIDQSNKKKVLELLAINPYKKDTKINITLLFKNNAIITLDSEIIEVILEDQKIKDDKDL